MNFWHAAWIWWKSDLQKSLRWGLKHIQIDTKCLNNQNDTDYLGKGPCIGQSVPEAVLGLQNTESSQQCTSQARATKIAILLILFGNLRISGFCNDLLLWRRSTCPEALDLFRYSILCKKDCKRSPEWMWYHESEGPSLHQSTEKAPIFGRSGDLDAFWIRFWCPAHALEHRFTIPKLCFLCLSCCFLTSSILHWVLDEFVMIS